MLPIDKIITKLYPAFGLLMIVMTTSIAVALLISAPQLPEMGDVFAYFNHSHYNNELLRAKPRRFTDLAIAVCDYYLWCNQWFPLDSSTYYGAA